MRRAAVARKAGKDSGFTQRKGREGWWVGLYEEGRQRGVDRSRRGWADHP